MSHLVWLLMLAAAVVAAQTPARKTPAALLANSTGTSATAGQKTKDKVVVASTDPVVTIHGLCESRDQSKPGSKVSSCATVVTRRKFEDFLDVMRATTRDIDHAAYFNVAAGYAGLLISSEAGLKAGVENDPRFPQVMEITRLRALGEMYRTQRLKELLQAARDEVEPYYKKHFDSYEEVDLDRFLLPKNNQANLSDSDFRAKAKRLAEELHARAVKGEDIRKLEKEGLEALGIKDLPAIAVGLRRGQFDEKADKEIFALGPGGVTSIMETTGVWVFYKRTNRQQLSLETVRSEIQGRLYLEKIDTLKKNLHDAVHVDYNEAYFGPDPAKAAASAKAGGPAKPEWNPKDQAAVAPGEVVLTIHGLCGSPAQGQEKPAPGSCTMTVTRAQFEMALKATTATKSAPAAPRGLAEGYLDLLIYGKAGERAGVEKDPRFAEVMKLARQRALGDMHRVKMDEQARQVSPGEIEASYKKNLAGFEEVTLRVVSIPKEKPALSKDPDYGAKAKRLAGELRERAAKGADMDKLQKEASEKLAFKAPETTLMRPERRGSMEAGTEQAILALKPGQVTEVLEIPNAYVMYRLESRRTVPLEEAKPEISLALYRQNLEKATKALSGSMEVDYNQAYFGSAPPSGWVSASTRASASPKLGSAK